jgi:hypothetical protein
LNDSVLINFEPIGFGLNDSGQSGSGVIGLGMPGSKLLDSRLIDSRLIDSDIINSKPIGFEFCDIKVIEVIDLASVSLSPEPCLAIASRCLPSADGSPTGKPLSGGPGMGEGRFGPCINPF